MNRQYNDHIRLYCIVMKNSTRRVPRRLILLMHKAYPRTTMEKNKGTLWNYRCRKRLWYADWEGEVAFIRRVIRLAFERRHSLKRAL